MRLIFLDIDGVLNHGYDPSRVPAAVVSGWGYAESPSTNAGFDYCVPSCVTALNDLTRATGASIVVSSSWREAHPLDELRAVLRRFGVEAEVVGVTPYDLEDVDGWPATRAAEIRAYLDRCEEEVGSYVVIDDCDIFLDVNNDRVLDPEVEARTVRTATSVGLTSEQGLLAARILFTDLPA
jgi:hypothetical protein